jgi:hypothetical protein
MKSNFKNTIRAPQRIIGLASKPFLLHEELKHAGFGYKVVDDSLLIGIEVGGEKEEVGPEHLLVTLFTKIHSII